MGAIPCWLSKVRLVSGLRTSLSKLRARPGTRWIYGQDVDIPLDHAPNRAIRTNYGGKFIKKICLYFNQASHAATVLRWFSRENRNYPPRFAHGRKTG